MYAHMHSDLSKPAALQCTSKYTNEAFSCHVLTCYKGSSKVKVAHLQYWTAALYNLRWQLIGTGCSTAAQASGCP